MNATTYKKGDIIDFEGDTYRVVVVGRVSADGRTCLRLASTTRMTWFGNQRRATVMYAWI